MGEKSPGDSPAVPIRTYLWEDLRRSRQKGEYPWTHLLKPPFDEEEYIKSHDHEYEPINPMPSVSPAAKSCDPEVSAAGEKPRERRFIRIPNTDQIIIPLHGDSDEEINPDRYENEDVRTEELPDPEAGYQSQSTPTTRTASRTDGEVNTSQVESSALEHLPLQKSARENGQNIGTRIRNQAGRIRTKLRNIPKPKITLPDRPKIKMPERPKFLTERPKFLTERPKFTMPERPKFLTEKPKFLTERPKFTMPERPKFLREKPKFLTERPKFNIDSSKLTMPKFDFMKKQPPPKKGTSSLRRPLREKSESVRSDAGSKKNLFDTFKSRTYPRIFNRKKKERGKRARTPPPRMETESSIPSSPSSRRNFNTKWVETYRDIKYPEDMPPAERKETYSEDENMEDPRQFQDSYFPEVTRMEEERKYTKAKAESTSSVMDSDKEQQSSGSSSARRRAGVLEEIDSDEFFLREKGLSREDVAVSRYLSLEIRDAFRSPKNALARMDTDSYDGYEEDLEVHEEPPKAPGRKRAEKPITRSLSKDSGEMERGAEIDREEEFNTFPLRPSRRKENEPASLGSSQRYIEPIEKPPRKYRSKSSSMQASLHSLPLSERQLEDEDVEMQGGSPPEPPKRRRSARDLSKRDADEWIPDDDDADIVPDEDMAHDIEDRRSFGGPVAPVRKTRSRGTSLADEDRTSRGLDSLPSEIPPEDELPLEELHQEEEPEREVEVVEERKSTLGDVDMAGYAVVAKEKTGPPRPPPPPTRHKKHLNTQLRTLKNHGINFFFTYPRRAIRSLQRPPVRPTRNYSTLGPSRPPRRSRVFREPVYVDGDAQEPRVEAEEAEESEEKILAGSDKEEEEGRDLQSGEVVEKMKGRPLPPPPRPPRKTREGEREVEETCEARSEERLEGERAEVGRIEEAVQQKRDDFFSVFSQIKPPPDLDIEKLEEDAQERRDVQQQTSFDIEVPTDSLSTPQTTSSTVTEVTVSVQTDPLPDDFLVEETETVSQISESLATEEVPPRYSVSPQLERATETPTSSRQEEKRAPEPAVVVQQVIPDKIHLSELEVDRLNVNEIQARKIVVSEIESQTMEVTEVNSKTGNLLLSGLEVSPEAIQSLASQIQTKIAESAPQQQPISIVSQAPPILVSTSPGELTRPVPQTSSHQDLIPKPKTSRSKGRKSPNRQLEDSEDELASMMPRWKKETEAEASTSRQIVASPPSAGELLAQLFSIWRTNLFDGMNRFIDTVNSVFPDGEKRRDAQTAACILLVLIAGLLMLGFGSDNTVHHHHWDYVPPR